MAMKCDECGRSTPTMYVGFENVLCADCREAVLRDVMGFRDAEFGYDGRNDMIEDNGQFREQEEDQYARYLDTFR